MKDLLGNKKKATLSAKIFRIDPDNGYRINVEMELETEKQAEAWLNLIVKTIQDHSKDYVVEFTGRPQ